jgi:hypothetical protein
MENIADIKASILKKFDELLTSSLTSLESGGKFSSSEIGKNIGKIINEELKDVRKGNSGTKKKKVVDKKVEEENTAKPKEKSKKSDDEKKSTRKPSLWNIYMKKKMAELKAENEEHGVVKSSKELLSDVALLWKEDKATFKLEEE